MHKDQKYREVLNWFTSSHRDEISLKSPLQDNNYYFATNGNSHIIYPKYSQDIPLYPPVTYPNLHRFTAGINWINAKPISILNVSSLLNFLNEYQPTIREQYECTVCMGDKFIKCEYCKCQTICLKCDKNGKTGFTGQIIPDPEYYVKIDGVVFLSVSIRKMIEVCMYFGIEQIYYLTKDEIFRNGFACGNMQLGFTPIRDISHNKIIKINTSKLT